MVNIFYKTLLSLRPEASAGCSHANLVETSSVRCNGDRTTVLQMRLDSAVLVDAEELFNLALLLLAPRIGLLVVLELYDLTIRRLDLVAVAQSGHGVELAVLARNLLRCAYALCNRIAAGPELYGVEHEYVSHTTHCVCRRNEDKDKLIEELVAGCSLVPTCKLVEQTE